MAMAMAMSGGHAPLDKVGRGHIAGALATTCPPAGRRAIGEPSSSGIVHPAPAGVVPVTGTQPPA